MRLRAGWAIGAAVLLLLLLLPLALGENQLSLPTEALIFGLAALTYDLIFGITGLISFGQALFVGAGAYTLAIAMADHHVGVVPALILAGLAGLILSLLTGLLALRTRGVYFAMVTLAFAQAAFTLVQSDVGSAFGSPTGGENGLVVTGIPAWLSGPGTGAHVYYVALAALVIGFLLIRLFVLSPVGRVWQAVRENEQRALLIGYRPYLYKLISYAISGTVAALAGALYALYVGDVSTDLLSSDLTIQLLLMVIIGGAGSLWGALIGAALIRYLNHYLNDLSASSFVTGLPTPLHAVAGQPLLIFGVIYLLLVFFFPQGIAGLAQRRFHLGRSLVPQPGLGEVEAATQTGVGVESTPPSQRPASPEGK